jgi:ubiquitin-conjugating enzyme E2 J1
LILEALISFLPSKGDGAIGALDWTSEERKKLAKKSVEYCCPVCGRCSDILKRMEIKIAKRGGERDTGGGGSGEGGMKSNRFQKEIEQLHALQMASHGLDVSVEQKSEQVHETRDAGKGQEENSQDKEDEKEGIRQQGGVETNQNELISLLADDHQEQMDGKQGGELPPKTLMNQPDETNEPIELEKKTETTLEADDDDRDQNHGSIKPKEERLEQVETNNVQVERLETPILSDPVIHTGIVVFGIIVWLLVRKLSAIIEDLKALETEIQQFR